MAKPVLKVKGVTKKFGSLIANDGVSFEVNKGEIVSLIGPNGAGKTTLFNCITGFLKPDKGEVLYRGRNITDLKSDQICRLGLSRTFQIVETIKEMTVKENVMTGAFLNTNRLGEAERIAEEILELTNLSSKSDTLGRNLTIANKKRLEIARVLATHPGMIMLDEAMAGLNQTEIKEAMELLLKIRESGITLLVVEHIMEAIMPISDRVIVLNAGEKIIEDIPEVVVNDDRVIKAYLGERYHDKSKKS